MNWIINDGEKIKTLKYFLKDLNHLDKQVKNRPPSGRATSRYGKTITSAISNSENVNKSSKDFISWLRSQDHSYLSNPHIRYQRSKIPQHFNIQCKDLSSAHPYNPVSKMNYYPINPMYQIPLQEKFFDKVTYPAYKSLNRELNRVQSNKPCNFNNNRYFRDKMRKGRIGLHVRAQNKPWTKGVGRMTHGMRA